LSRAVGGSRLRVGSHGTRVSIVRQRKWIPPLVCSLPRHLYFNPMIHVVVAIVISYRSVTTMDGLVESYKNSQSITSRRNIVGSLSKSARILKRIRILPCQICPWFHCRAMLVVLPDIRRTMTTMTMSLIIILR
jgi:hypothetical protein